jgi:hypothetical protein
MAPSRRSCPSDGCQLLIHSDVGPLKGFDFVDLKKYGDKRGASWREFLWHHPPQARRFFRRFGAELANRAEPTVSLPHRSTEHPRCLNCHPAGDRPTQGMDAHPHLPLVVRGADGHGAIGMRCTNCHGPANYDPARVPGHELWHLAPIEMAWQGKTLGEICEQIKDPKQNGGKTLEDLVHHMGEDSLVGWGWNPGAGREPAPGTQKELGNLVEAWVNSGAACPAP